MEIKKIEGMVAAAFTPMDADGNVELETVPKLADFLIEHGVQGIYVCGSTGEGPSLTSEERKLVAAAFVKSVSGKVPVFVHVGHNSIADAKELASHAQSIGADYISAVAPSYFKIGSLKQLVNCLSEITSAAPGMPFYYYHIPRLTNVSMDMYELLKISESAIPSLAGIKFTSGDLFEYQACLNFLDRKYDMLYGTDEMLLSALAVGAEGYIGSTYNFMAPVYKQMRSHFDAGNLQKAQSLQLKSVQIVKIIMRYGGLPAQKEMMRMAGVDCGKVRHPLQRLSAGDEGRLKKDLQEAGFFEIAY